MTKFYQAKYFDFPENLVKKIKNQENQATSINLCFSSQSTRIKVPANKKIYIQIKRWGIFFTFWLFIAELNVF